MDRVLHLRPEPTLFVHVRPDLPTRPFGQGGVQDHGWFAVAFARGLVTTLRIPALGRSAYIPFGAQAILRHALGLDHIGVANVVQPEVERDAQDPLVGLLLQDAQQFIRGHLGFVREDRLGLQQVLTLGHALGGVTSDQGDCRHQCGHDMAEAVPQAEREAA